jgi:hypothetical protein
LNSCPFSAEKPAFNRFARLQPEHLPLNRTTASPINDHDDGTRKKTTDN